MVSPRWFELRDDKFPPPAKRLLHRDLQRCPILQRRFSNSKPISIKSRTCHIITTQTLGLWKFQLHTSSESSPSRSSFIPSLPFLFPPFLALFLPLPVPPSTFLTSPSSPSPFRSTPLTSSWRVWRAVHFVGKRYFSHCTDEWQEVSCARDMFCLQTVTMVTKHLLSAAVLRLTYFGQSLTYILPTTMTSWAVAMTYKRTRVKTSTIRTITERQVGLSLDITSYLCDNKAFVLTVT